MAGAATSLRLALALVVGGVVFAAPVVLLPGVALMLLVLACVAWVRLSVRGVRAQRHGVPAQIGEGERFEVLLEGVSGWVPLVARIEDPAVAGPATLRVLRPRSRFTLRLAGSLARRGRHRLAAPTLRIADPLGICVARVVAGAPDTILVLPRIEALAGQSSEDGPALGRRNSGLGELAAGGERESSADPELDGVRPFRPGTKATRIYWPALARGSDLAERHLVAAGDAAPLIALDPSCASDGEDLDRAVRAAASVMAHLAGRGGCELLIGGSRQRLRVGRESRGWVNALAALAVVEASHGPPRLSSSDLRTSVIWVAARPAAGVPRGVSRGFIVSPGQRHGASVAFAVAGCSGYALGSRQLRGEAA